MATIKKTYAYLNSKTSECEYNEMLKACFPKNPQRRMVLLSEVFYQVGKDRFNQICDYITYNCPDLDCMYKTILKFRKKAKLPIKHIYTCEIDRAIVICEIQTLYVFDTMIFHKLYNFLVEKKIIDDQY